MEAPTGTGATKESVVSPKDRRVPLSIVAFRSLTSIPGVEDMVTVVEFGRTRLSGGKAISMPQPFLDPTLRTIWIEGREYPLESVHYWERAKMATSKKPPAVIPDYTIGRLKVKP